MSTRSSAAPRRYCALVRPRPEKLANAVYGGAHGQLVPRDGWKYRGRGLFQLTGLDAYLAYERASGRGVVANPDGILQPDAAPDSAAWFWSAHGCDRLADARDWQGLTRAINGGLNGLAERQMLIVRALNALR